MMWKQAVLGIEPMTYGSESECANPLQHRSAPQEPLSYQMFNLISFIFFQQTT